MEAERRRPSLAAQPCAQPLEEGDGEVAAVFLSEHLEPRGREGILVGLGRGEETGGLVGGPGDGIGQRAVADPHDVVDADLPPWGQNPRRFGEQRGLVGDVHADVKHGRDLEGCRLERQRKRACLAERHLLRQTDPCGERGCDLHILVRQIDPDDLGAMVCGEVSRGAADPAADIEQAHAGLEPKGLSQALRRLTAADMELVDGREIRRPQARGVFAEGRQSIADRRFEAAVGVMAGDGFLSSFEVGLGHGPGSHLSAIARRSDRTGRIRAMSIMPGWLFPVSGGSIRPRMQSFGF